MRFFLRGMKAVWIKVTNEWHGPNETDRMKSILNQTHWIVKEQEDTKLSHWKRYEKSIDRSI